MQKVYEHCLVTLPLTINQTLFYPSHPTHLAILMQNQSGGDIAFSKHVRMPALEAEQTPIFADDIDGSRRGRRTGKIRGAP